VNILVTGSSSGIGLATRTRLLATGHYVVGLARRPQAPSERFVPVSIDLSDLDALPERLRDLLRSQPPFDALVCCAGRGHFGDLEQFSPAHIRDLIDLDFTSHALVVRALLPDMKRRGDGRIVLLGSEAALRGTQKGSIYCAAKFALRGFAQALREETARHGISVTLINPGMVRTPFFDGLDFRPGPDANCAIEADDVAAVIIDSLTTRAGTAIDEINLSPQKKVIDFNKKGGTP
jgi:3-hydroxy acid dehydrogenase/malonic semialdehyde reductase